MMVKVLYFAGLREALATSGEEIRLPAGVASVAALRDHVAARGEPWAQLARTRNLRCAVNHAMAGFDAAVRDGDEVAFFPPVTGG
ncbi:MAG: molybdopterin converting factor subunit 1 [Rhodocyclaceae bacterium]|jgi:molybdopterin synthase sulfur carrier subunit|nr:molybdopterin converting factor subunit 1 [Rhodocyclaceae bacterium]MBK6553092.1 molybdopterin converting factor subunit 1 [Rhodocyclaceae bacterium]MBK6675966.1 molybdopterin converting factor subunit 1 [Rhodocyclaceae bacterium]MBK9311413.1 molybdopterin converting factor subunit 1 [Rhodocyclaceae bacterium]MBK9956431.1 molybdopterin converting factor subunit 1 [Rhodocyclaceae bacterium]